MDVVAEGAETDSDAVELSQLGCEYAQGFVFGEPMTAERARDLIQAQARESKSARHAVPAVATK
jgi:EAL domain-containing protein (putative c-di-GMP-specific phosphodiesterase class I)